MVLSARQRDGIEDLLSKKISDKLSSYGRETTFMPFLASLIQDDEKVAAYSFIHSMATTLGMSIYEDVSVILASENSDKAHRNYGVGGVISKEQKSVIANIVRELRNGEREANIEREVAEVLEASAVGGEYQKEGNIADFYMVRDGREYFFEIKTVKPNMDVFNKSKTKLLEWVARRGSSVGVFLAFPYNPYHPEPYSRFTETGMMDFGSDFLVGDKYWDFIGGCGSFIEILDLFDATGKKFKHLLDSKFKELAAKSVSYRAVD